MRVALFVSCLTDTFFPRVGEAVVRVLRHYGCSVEFPESQTCCGQPAFNSGLHADAAAVARKFVEDFAGLPAIVTPSASCATMIREHIPALLRDDPRLGEDSRLMRQAAEIAARTHEFACFLRDRLSVDIARALRPTAPYTFHYPCHARQICSVDELEQCVASAALRPPAKRELCCGFGGTFGVDYPQISGGMAEDRLADLSATGATSVICNEGGCTLHLAGVAHRRGLPLRFKHLAEMLAESLGLMEPLP